MSYLQNFQRKLSEGVSSWLTYQFSCNRGNLFNEKYLSYPIGNILQGLTDYSVKAEVNHPMANNGSKGRPLQVDFVLFSKDEIAKWEVAIESKWVGRSNVSMNDFYWDLVRLQNLHLTHPGVKTYFLIAGFDKKLDSMLEGFDIFLSKNRKVIIKNEIAVQNRSFLKFKLSKIKKHQVKSINEKIEKYDNFQLYDLIICRPAHIYPDTRTHNMCLSTIVFEVLPGRIKDKVESLTYQ